MSDAPSSHCICTAGEPQSLSCFKMFVDAGPTIDMCPLQQLTFYGVSDRSRDAGRTNILLPPLLYFPRFKGQDL